MDRESARLKIRSLVSCKDFLEKSPKGNYICPFCGSGTGPEQSGALYYYEKTNTWTCFSGKCPKVHGDVIDLYMQKTGTDYNEALSLLANEIGISIDSYDPAQRRIQAAQRDFSDDAAEYTPEAEQQQGEPAAAADQGAADQQPAANYKAYYKACRLQIRAQQISSPRLIIRPIIKPAGSG